MLRSQGAIEPKICLQTFCYAAIPFLSTQYFFPFNIQSVNTYRKEVSLERTKTPGWRVLLF